MNGLRRLIVCTLVGLIVSVSTSFAHDETPVVTVSSASFERDVPLAPDAIASGFGEELATVTESATTVPLPTELAGTTVVLTDSTGVERPAQLVFVSAKQVNYLIPAGMATGLAAVRITSGDGDISTGVVDIASVSPGLFTANATGGGVAAGSVLRVAEDGISAKPIARFDAEQGVFVPVTVDLSPGSGQVYLILFGTGIRHLASLGDVAATVGGVAVPVLYAGEQGEFEGLDQVNLGPLPPELSGRGELSIELTVEGSTSNKTTVSLSGPTVEFVTFSNQIAPIFQKRCQSCHHPGEVAPFSLMTYEDAQPHAAEIRANVRSRYMPPWKPVPGVGEFVDERRLTEEEIDLISRWVDGGALEGDPAKLPEPLQFSDDWTLGTPDFITVPEAPFTPNPFATDVYRCFSVPTGLESKALARSFEVRPGNRTIVHHLILYGDPDGASAALDAADPGPGYDCFGGPGIETQTVYGGWSPGGRPLTLPEDVAVAIPAGGRIVMQVHYHPDGTQQSDQTRVGFFSSDHPSPKEMLTVIFGNFDFLIPAGARDYEVTESQNVAILRGSLLNVYPHMHLLGRTIKFDLKRPDGTLVPLIEIEDWDFDWQDSYSFKEPVEIQPFSELTVTCTYDNSDGNPLNPNKPPKPVTYGEGTNDEMCIMGIGFILE